MPTNEERAAYCDRQAQSCESDPQLREHAQVWRDRAIELRRPVAGGLTEAKECIDAAVFEIGDRFHELPEWMQDIWNRRVMWVLGIEEGGNG